MSTITGGPGIGAGGVAVAGPLKPAITRPMLTLFVVGDVLGAGIYALVGTVAGETGGAIWTAFAAAGVLALFTAVAYAELVTKYPQAAGAALYVHRAWRRPFSSRSRAWSSSSCATCSPTTTRPSASTTIRSTAA